MQDFNDFAIRFLKHHHGCYLHPLFHNLLNPRNHLQLYRFCNVIHNYDVHNNFHAHYFSFFFSYKYIFFCVRYVLNVKMIMNYKIYTSKVHRYY